ncbi:MAG: hypothetical protein ACTHLW_00785 [Verrucomicrobiota bacterium]
MNNLKKRNVLIMALISTITFLVLAFGWPIIEKWRLQRRFPWGTSLADVQKQLRSPHEISSGGIVFPDREPSENERRLYTFFELDVPEENVRLEFDYYTNLNGILIKKHPLVATWKRWKED